MVTSLVNERWNLMNRGIDRETHLPMCHVRRITRDTIERVTIWRLVQRPKGWYNVGTMIGSLSEQGFRPAPEKNGKKLSNSRTDLILLSHAQHGHGAAYV